MVVVENGQNAGRLLVEFICWHYFPTSGRVSQMEHRLYLGLALWTHPRQSVGTG